MIPVVLMVRHGRTELNDPVNPKLRAWEDPPLDRRGQLDAQLAAQLIKPHKPQIVYSSDLARDSETANIIADELQNIPFEIDYGLRTADMGEWSGRNEADVEQAVENWYAVGFVEAPSGESLNNFLARFYPCFDAKFELARKVDGFRPSIVVSHGRCCAAIHARAEMLHQGDARMPLPGGVMAVGLDDLGELKVEFLSPTEPVLRDA
jgi:broad specificity phosphatase PhoE